MAWPLHHQKEVQGRKELLVYYEQEVDATANG
jgi:hypothetical protein